MPLQGGVEEGVKDIIEGEDPDTWLDTPGEEEEGEEGAWLHAAPASANAVAVLCCGCAVLCSASCNRSATN